MGIEDPAEPLLARSNHHTTDRIEPSSPNNARFNGALFHAARKPASRRHDAAHHDGTKSRSHARRAVRCEAIRGPTRTAAELPGGG